VIAVLRRFSDFGSMGLARTPRRPLFLWQSESHFGFIYLGEESMSYKRPATRGVNGCIQPREGFANDSQHPQEKHGVDTSSVKKQSMAVCGQVS